jgi:hypothetical protein
MAIICIADGMNSHYFDLVRELADRGDTLIVLPYYKATATPTTCSIKEFTQSFEIAVSADICIEKMAAVFHEKHQDLRSGKIRRLWDDYHGIWILWKPKPVAQNTGIIFNKIFRRRFQGFNHGRHWDRKRRN